MSENLPTVVLEVKGLLEVVKCVDADNDETVKASIKALSCPSFNTERLEKAYQLENDAMKNLLKETEEKLNHNFSELSKTVEQVDKKKKEVERLLRELSIERESTNKLTSELAKEKEQIDIYRKKSSEVIAQATRALNNLMSKKQLLEKQLSDAYAELNAMKSIKKVETLTSRVSGNQSVHSLDDQAGPATSHKSFSISKVRTSQDEQAPNDASPTNSQPTSNSRLINQQSIATTTNTADAYGNTVPEQTRGTSMSVKSKSTLLKKLSTPAKPVVTDTEVSTEPQVNEIARGQSDSIRSGTPNSLAATHISQDTLNYHNDNKEFSVTEGNVESKQSLLSKSSRQHTNSADDLSLTSAVDQHNLQSTSSGDFKSTVHSDQKLDRSSITRQAINNNSTAVDKSVTNDRMNQTADMPIGISSNPNITPKSVTNLDKRQSSVNSTCQLSSRNSLDDKIVNEKSRSTVNVDSSNEIIPTANKQSHDRSNGNNEDSTLENYQNIASNLINSLNKRISRNDALINEPDYNNDESLSHHNSIIQHEQLHSMHNNDNEPLSHHNSSKQEAQQQARFSSTHSHQYSLQNDDPTSNQSAKYSSFHKMSSRVNNQLSVNGTVAQDSIALAAQFKERQRSYHSHSDTPLPLCSGSQSSMLQHNKPVNQHHMVPVNQLARHESRDASINTINVYRSTNNQYDYNSNHTMNSSYQDNGTIQLKASNGSTDSYYRKSGTVESAATTNSMSNTIDHRQAQLVRKQSSKHSIGSHKISVHDDTFQNNVEDLSKSISYSSHNQGSYLDNEPMRSYSHDIPQSESYEHMNSRPSHIHHGVDTSSAENQCHIRASSSRNRHTNDNMLHTSFPVNYSSSSHSSRSIHDITHESLSSSKASQSHRSRSDFKESLTDHRSYNDINTAHKSLSRETALSGSQQALSTSSSRLQKSRSLAFRQPSKEFPGFNITTRTIHTYSRKPYCPKYVGSIYTSDPATYNEICNSKLNRIQRTQTNARRTSSLSQVTARMPSYSQNDASCCGCFHYRHTKTAPADVTAYDVDLHKNSLENAKKMLNKSHIPVRRLSTNSQQNNSQTHFSLFNPCKHADTFP